MTACTLFYGAADLLDDADDGDLADEDTAVARAASVEMLFVSAGLVAELGPPSRVRALVRRFSSCGAAMAAGQGDDLAGTDRLDARDPIAIARAKAGGELALFFAGAADVAGRAPTRFESVGRALGTLLQVISDYDDVLGRGSRDVRDARPSHPLRGAPGGAERVLLAHAGLRTQAVRVEAARAALATADARASARDTLHALVTDARAAMGARPEPAVRAWIDAAAALADETLRRLARLRPHTIDGRPEVDAAMRAARDFLDEDPTLERATEVCRHGLFGAPEVRGDLFGRLFTAWLFDDDVPRELALAALARGDADGWRYYPGWPQVPPDADDTGLALQLAARLGIDDARLALGEAQLVANQRADGRFETWLAHDDAHRRTIAAQWVMTPCPVASAQAAWGLACRRGERGRSAVLAATRELLRAFGGDEAPPSPYYAPVVVDALGGELLLRLTTASNGRAQRDARRALARVAARLVARRTVGSRWGTALETALAVRTLAALDALDAPEAALRTLVDLQEADGGYPADPFFHTVPHRITTHYGARAVTTAAALSAMQRLAVRVRDWRVSVASPVADDPSPAP